MSEEAPLLMRFHLPLLLALSAVATAQWTKVEVPTTSSLRGLSVVSANVIWASGTGGTVIKTLNSGKTWAAIVVTGAEKLDFRGIRAFDDQTALIMSSGPAEQGQARIYLTRNGGQSWQQVFEEKRAGIFFDAIAFWDRRHGIVLSDPIDGHFALFRTDDGGATWQQIPPGAIPPALPNEGAFAASNSCLTVNGHKDVWFATGGAQVARVFHSTDHGETWTVAETPMHPANASSGIFSLVFPGAKYGFAAGGDYAHPEKSDLPNLMWTSDSGASWQQVTPTNPIGVYLSSAIVIWRPGKDSIVAAGPTGAIISNGGSPWNRESAESLNSLATTGGHSPIVWAVGANGAVMRKRMRLQSLAQ